MGDYYRAIHNIPLWPKPSWAYAGDRVRKGKKGANEYHNVFSNAAGKNYYCPLCEVREETPQEAAEALIEGEW